MLIYFDHADWFSSPVNVSPTLPELGAISAITMKQSHAIFCLSVFLAFEANPVFLQGVCFEATTLLSRYVWEQAWQTGKIEKNNAIYEVAIPTALGQYRLHQLICLNAQQRVSLKVYVGNRSLLYNSSIALLYWQSFWKVYHFFTEVVIYLELELTVGKVWILLIYLFQ